LTRIDQIAVRSGGLHRLGELHHLARHNLDLLADIFIRATLGCEFHDRRIDRHAERHIPAAQRVANGVSILHFLGGHSADIKGTRAISQTKMTISQRARVHDVEVDVVCTGRFYDFLEKRDGRWGFVLRQPIYEKDRMDPVDPATTMKLDQNLLMSFPEGYRHLAYLQSQIGYPIKKDMPGLKGEAVEKLYARGKQWLNGGALY